MRMTLGPPYQPIRATQAKLYMYDNVLYRI